MSKDPQILFLSDTFELKSALHIAAASFAPKAVDAVRWLLKKGIPWSARDREGRLVEEWARMSKNEESCTVLRNWAIEFGDVLRILCIHAAYHPHRIRVTLQVKPGGGPSRRWQTFRHSALGYSQEK